MPRSLDAILVAAVKLIERHFCQAQRPLTTDSVETFRAQLKSCIQCARDIHQRTANMPPPGEMRDRAAAYLKVLERARKAAGTVRSFHQSGDFLAALDREIWEVDGLTCLVVRANDGQQRDQVADVATIMARNLIDPDPNRHPENRGKNLPAIDCPWRQPARLTRGGAWLGLASLIFEGATGTRGRDMMEYARHIDERQPRYVARLHFQPPS